MSTNTDKLAEALRRLVNTFPIPVDGVAQADRASLRLALLTAREALAAHDAEQALPLKDRPDFIAGYDAGLKDGRACERRDAAEQAAQAVPAGFKWVPVEPTKAMLIAAAATDVGPDADGVHRLEPWLTALWAAMLSAAPRPEAVAGWQPIETAPKDGTRLILSDGKFVGAGVWVGRYFAWGVSPEPTHWMPLPAAPGTTTGEQHG